MELKYHKFKLRNGVRVVMVPRKETRAIYIEAMFKVGSRYESDDIRGISHFLEHMAFKGTVKRPSYVQINKEVDQYGGTYNAYTGTDVTGYWVKLPAEKLELGIDLISDIVINSKLAQKELEKEKGTILEEIKLKHDDPQSFCWVKLSELLFGNTPLGKDIIGTEETVKSINHEKLLKFRSRYYKANNLVIAIGGNIKVSEAKRLLEKYFGKIKGEIRDVYEKNVSTQKAPLIKIYKRAETKQAKLAMGFRAFGKDRDIQDRATLALMSAILGGYTSSILFSEIREERGLCYDIGAMAGDFDEVGALEIGGGFDINKLPEAIQAIMEILREIKTKGFTQKDIKMGKDNRTGKLELSLEGAGGWASNIASQLLYENRADSPEKIIKMIEKVSNSDLKRIAREVFDSKNLSMVIVGPIDPEKEENYRKLIKL